MPSYSRTSWRNVSFRHNIRDMSETSWISLRIYKVSVSSADLALILASSMSKDLKTHCCSSIPSIVIDSWGKKERLHHWWSFKGNDRWTRTVFARNDHYPCAEVEDHHVPVQNTSQSSKQRVDQKVLVTSLIAPTTLRMMNSRPIDQWLSIETSHPCPSNTCLIKTLAVRGSFSFHCSYYSNDNFSTVDILVLIHCIMFFFDTVLRCGSVFDQEPSLPSRMVWCVDRCIARFYPLSLRLARWGW